MLRDLSEITADSAGITPRLSFLVAAFSDVVNTNTFPCVYSQLPFSAGDLHFDHLHDDESLDRRVIESMRRLCDIITESPDAIGVFFIERNETAGLQDDLALARRLTRAVMRADALDNPGEPVVSPDSPEWTLRLNGIALFLNFSSPAHELRRSRNVGPAFTVIAQARESFDRFGRSNPRARQTIRRRLAGYDAVAPHPSLAHYGDVGAREAHQYFLGDGLVPLDVTEGANGD